MNIGRLISVLSIVLCPMTCFSEAKNVAICQIVEHTALNQIREGIKEELSGMEIGWSEENAQGNPTLASQIAKKVSGEPLDLIIALATPMAQAVASTNFKPPILFGAVSDPVSAKLVPSLDKPSKNITGVTDAVPTIEVFRLLNQLLPNAKTVGVMYNSGESNSAAQVEKFKSYAADHNIRIVEVSISKSSEVLSATKRLVGEVDAILLPTDNTVISALEAITKPAIHHKIPVIGTDVETVKRGALVAIGVDWRAQGHQLGKMATKVLNGTPIDQLPVEDPERLYMHINLHTAKQIGLEINPDLIQKADHVYEI